LGAPACSVRESLGVTWPGMLLTANIHNGLRFLGQLIWQT
jgi:hypothetical protein